MTIVAIREPCGHFVACGPDFDRINADEKTTCPGCSPGGMLSVNAVVDETSMAFALASFAVAAHVAKGGRDADAKDIAAERRVYVRERLITPRYVVFFWRRVQ